MLKVICKIIHKMGEYWNLYVFIIETSYGIFFEVSIFSPMGQQSHHQIN